MGGSGKNSGTGPRPAGFPALFVARFFVLSVPAGRAVAGEAGDDPAPVLILPPAEIRARRPVPAAREDEAAAASVITREEMTRPGVDLPALLDRHPGLRVTRMGGLGAFTAVSVRGSTADQVRVYVDGVLLNSADGRLPDLSLLSLGALERVEVYRGVAPATLPGSAIGGVLHLRTRRAAEPRLELAAGGGSFGTRSARAFFAMPLEPADVVVSLDYRGGEGDFTFQHDVGSAWKGGDDRTETRRNNGFDAVSGLAKVNLRLGQRVELTVQDTVQWSRRGLAGVAAAPTRRSELEELSNIVALALDGHGEGVDPWSWQLRVSLTTTLRQLGDPDAEVGLAARATRDLSLVPRVGSTVRWPVTPWFAPSFAAEYRYERFQPEDTLAIQAIGPASSRHVVEGTLALAFRADAIDTQILPSAGFEWTRSELFRPDPFDPRLGAHRELDTTVATGRLGLVNTSLAYTTFKANAGRAARLPTLFELFGDSGYTRGNPSLDPETSWFVDAGFVHDATWLPRPHRLQLDVFCHYSEVDDLIQFVRNSQNLLVAGNIASARLAGVEVWLRWDLWSHLRGAASYTFLHTEDTSGIPRSDGRDLPLRPRHHWHARLEGYGKLCDFIPEAGLYVEADGSSESHPDPANLATLPARAYLAVGTYAWLWGRRFRLELVARNVTNNQTLDLVGHPLPGWSLFGTLEARVW